MTTSRLLAQLGIAVVVVSSVACSSSSGARVTSVDASTPEGDANGDDAAICTTTAECPVVTSGGGITFDSCGACDECVATSCCTATTTCFSPGDAGAESACAMLVDCEIACGPSDAGDDSGDDAGDDDAGNGACASICEAAFSADIIQQAHDFLSCFNGACAPVCPN